ncbi:MAG: hypothetical protein QUS07_07200 [Methanothrix sp.]|nr:hypothetical protein [Methanothrix sp.]
MGEWIIVRWSKHSSDWETISDGEDAKATTLDKTFKTYQEAEDACRLLLKEEPDSFFGIFRLYKLGSTQVPPPDISMLR